MALNKSKGNMYSFITHTWDTIKGACPHDCGYCYMKRWGQLNPVHLDEKELKTDLSDGNFIFVGSSCDMWADDIPSEWIEKTLEKCRAHPDNSYLFQTKNPGRFSRFTLPETSVVCTTLETNRWYDVMGNSPSPWDRVIGLSGTIFRRYVTVEPVMDFDVEIFASMIRGLKPEQVNIGADSGGHGLPEPSAEKISQLIYLLEGFTTVHQKSNLKRLFKIK